MGILVVDDSLSSRTFVRDTLLEGGFLSVIALRSGQDAIELLNGEVPGKGYHSVDLILLDIMMPDFNGIETCRRIKAMPQSERIPIIMFTGKPARSYLKSAFAAGASDYITKPVDKEELIIRIQSALAIKRKMDRYHTKVTHLQTIHDPLEKALFPSMFPGEILHVCTSCKKIRNGPESWQPMEEFLVEHSDLHLNGDLCKPCVADLYPGVQL